MDGEKEEDMTKQEYIALLDEAIRMGKELNSMWEEAFSYTQTSADEGATKPREGWDGC